MGEEDESSMARRCEAREREREREREIWSQGISVGVLMGLGCTSRLD
jgi:hypothetical protein